VERQILQIESRYTDGARYSTLGRVGTRDSLFGTLQNLPKTFYFRWPSNYFRSNHSNM